MPDIASIDKSALRNIAGLTGPNFVGDTDIQTLTKKIISFRDSSTNTDRITLSGATLFSQSGGVFSPVTGSAISFDVVPTQAVNTNSAGGIFRVWSTNDTSNYDLFDIWYTGSSGFLLGTTLNGTATAKPFTIRCNGTSMITLSADTTNVDLNSKLLKNANISADSNTLSGVAQKPKVKRWGCFQPSASSATTAAGISNLIGIIGNHTPTGAGTNTLTFDTTEGIIANFVATATANLNIGIVSGTTGPICRRLFGCRMSCRVKIDSTTSARMYVGFAAAALAVSDTPIATGVDGVLVGFTSAATNFEIYSNDATGTMTTTAITGPIAKNANWHTIEINWTASGNVDVIFDGVTQTLSANIPLTTTNLFFNAVGQTTTTTARTFSIHDIWIECDK